MTRKHFNLAPVAAAALLLGLAGGVQTGARADAAGSHPKYLTAFAHPRDARSCLNVTNKVDVRGSEKRASLYIDKAMYEISQAAKHDNINVPNSRPIYQGNLRQGRLKKAITLVQAAESALVTDDSNEKAQGWKKVAVSHMDASITAINQAQNDEGGKAY